MDNRERTNPARPARADRGAPSKPGIAWVFAACAHVRPPSPPRPSCCSRLAFGVQHSSAQIIEKEKPEQIQGVDVEEKLGLPVATRLTLTDSSGETLPLSTIFDGDKPVVVAPVYFGCPVVCPLVLDRLTNSFREPTTRSGRISRSSSSASTPVKGPPSRTPRRCGIRALRRGCRPRSRRRARGLALRDRRRDDRA